MTGDSNEDPLPEMVVKISPESLEDVDVRKDLRTPKAGAITVFYGTTRDNFQDKVVTRLEYTAYVPMAEREIRKIGLEARKKWPSLNKMAVYHRLGNCPVTETSVICGVSSPHRRNSLECCSFLIDELKARVPIWKKELYAPNGRETTAPGESDQAEQGVWKANKEFDKSKLIAKARCDGA